MRAAIARICIPACAASAVAERWCQEVARAIKVSFTTQGPGRVTGLELLTARTLAVAVSCSHFLSNIPGKGTTISLWVPAANPADDPMAANGKEGGPYGSRCSRSAWECEL